MRYLFLLNPTAGKRDCTAELAPAIQAAAQRAGIPPEKKEGRCDPVRGPCPGAGR